MHNSNNESAEIDINCRTRQKEGGPVVKKLDKGIPSPEIRKTSLSTWDSAALQAQGHGDSHWKP